MQPFICSSSFFSELNQLRYNEWQARHLVADANRGRCPKRLAMRHYNRARAALRHYLYGTKPKRRHVADFDWRIEGIPCGIAVTYVDTEDNIVEFVIVDHSGYEADWLESKLTRDDVRAIEKVIEDGQDCRTRRHRRRPTHRVCDSVLDQAWR